MLCCVIAYQKSTDESRSTDDFDVALWESCTKAGLLAIIVKNHTVCHVKLILISVVQKIESATTLSVSQEHSCLCLQDGAKP